jgi:hypothetical protein
MKTPFRFAISGRVLLWFLISTLQKLNRSISRILYPDIVGTAIIHLGQSLPNGSSDLPGGRIPSYRDSGGQPLTPPYLVLHCEEFAWPRVLPHAPVRSYIKPETRPHRFTHHPD